MRKLLLILICLFVSNEVKSEYIVLECEVKKKLYKINNIEEELRMNILDTSFDLVTLYFDEKLEWLNDSKINEKHRDRIKFRKEKMNTFDDESKGTPEGTPDWFWFLDDNGDSYEYHFKGFYKGHAVDSLVISLNKDSGYFEYRMDYRDSENYHLYDTPFYKKSYYSDGFVSSGICKKMKKSLF
tara:strand:+ start:101 stop:652 length:552 start_codon:yes stop_codon:yes gene_type:complete